MTRLRRMNADEVERILRKYNFELISQKGSHSPELPGCTSAGITQEEALNNIREAIELYLQPDAIDLLPGAVIREVMVG
ncbi:MAG: hypothetical protein BEV12_05710 [Microcystis aeruginosa CACIAM 03]|nr:MAG: hypothetical protein BEV12_05710 [Microcystis aeruginosa CACIAM 03]